MTSMKHIFEFQWRNELSRTTNRNKTTGGNKLRTFYTFKKNFVYEKYLDLQGDFTLRRKGTNLCSYTPKFLHPYVPTTYVPTPYVPTPLCSYTTMFLHPYTPTNPCEPCSYTPMFLHSYLYVGHQSVVCPFFWQ